MYHPMLIGRVADDVASERRHDARRYGALRRPVTRAPRERGLARRPAVGLRLRLS